MNGTRKKLLLVAVAMVAVSAVVATQYARATIGYEYGVSATDGAIRFIARDKAPDGNYVLQNDSYTLKLKLGTFTPGTNKTYTAAFGIVNEESFNISLTNVTVDGAGASNVKIWLHKDPNATIDTDGTAVLVWNGTDVSFTPVTFDAGDNSATDASSDAGTINTPVASNSGVTNVRYNTTSGTIGDNNDYWWVQISIDIPAGTANGIYNDGSIYFEFSSV